ncbi:hypothetical protein ACIRPH_31085 [Nocardiopsis sp. NPDC101807]|uniref:hypothetical protein n=1 Tax=Nocardiopsis sp. NPDC101807 TaxID=3364339 RepID=UPI003816C6B2
MIFPDAQLVATTYLRAALGDIVQSVSSEPPGPDDFVTPLLVITALRPPAMPNRWALSASRLFFTVIADDQPTANHVAAIVNGHVRAMAGATVEILGGTATVSTVRNVSAPEAGDDSNQDQRDAAFSGELLLRPLRTP